MLTLFVRVEARHGAKVVFESNEPVRGYFQRLGVTGHDEVDLAELIRQYIADDTDGTVIAVDDRSEPDFGGSDADIWGKCGDIDLRGVWYHSGRAFYGPEDE